MQIELIATASEDSAYLPRLGLGVLAALTPESDEVIYADDLVKPFDVERDVKDVDLVGISVDSKTASRSYAIAAGTQRFRSQRDFDPVSTVLSAIASDVGPLHPPEPAQEGAPRRLRVVGE